MEGVQVVKRVVTATIEGDPEIAAQLQDDLLSYIRAWQEQNECYLDEYVIRHETVLRDVV